MRSRQYLGSPFSLRIRQKLVQGELPLNDNAGDPKLPAFLYDEDEADGSLTKGLFHGPLLVAVSPVSVFGRAPPTFGV